MASSRWVRLVSTKSQLAARETRRERQSRSHTAGATSMVLVRCATGSAPGGRGAQQSSSAAAAAPLPHVSIVLQRFADSESRAHARARAQVSPAAAQPARTRVSGKCQNSLSDSKCAPDGVVFRVRSRQQSSSKCVFSITFLCGHRDVARAGSLVAIESVR